MSIAIIDMICYHTKNKNMLECQIYDIADKDMKDLVYQFFDFRNKQFEVKEDKCGNFFIERDDIDNRRQNEYYACLKKIIFRKNGNIDVEMCIGDDEMPYTVNIKEYKTIQPTNDLYQEYSVLQPFNWTNLNQGDLTKDNVFRLLNNNVKDQQAFGSFKKTLIRQISKVFYEKNNQELNQERCGNEQKDNSFMNIGTPIINIMTSKDRKEDNINQNIHQDANVNPQACDALETEIKQTLEEFISDIELTQPTQCKADIVITNKKGVIKNNNKITEINISPNKYKPCSVNDVKFNIFINGKKYSISHEIDILPFVQNCSMGLKVCKDFLKDVKKYFQDKNNKKKFVETMAKDARSQINKNYKTTQQQEKKNNNIIDNKELNDSAIDSVEEGEIIPITKTFDYKINNIENYKIIEENNKIIPKEHQNNNDIINHKKELSIIDENEKLSYYNNNIVIDDEHITDAEDKIDENEELRYKNNNVVTDKQKNPNENITSNAEDKKHTALNTSNSNEDDINHTEDHYIARKTRNCLSTIDCCDCLSLDTMASRNWDANNSPYIFY